VQALLCAGDVDGLIKVIVLLAVNGGGNITGGIEGGAVALEELSL